MLTWALVSGCAGEGRVPPFEELRLRDALLASPSAIADMPADSRRALAARMERALMEQRERAELDRTAASDALGYLEALDDRRIARGDDAVLVTVQEPRGATVGIRTLDFGSPDGGVAFEPEPFGEALALELADEALREEPYASALAGEAGDVLRRLAGEAGVTRLVLRASIPAAAVADGEQIWVNPAWLVLFATDDDAVGALHASLIDVPTTSHTPPADATACGANPGACGTGPYCSSSWGTCECEGCQVLGCGCGGGDGCHTHCRVAEPPRSTPLSPLWLVAPLAYLAWWGRR